MKRLFIVFMTVIVSISTCQVGADERTAIYSDRSSSSFARESVQMDIPPWVVHIPENSFVGISSPCASIDKARQQALDSAIGLILQSMGADYHLYHESLLSGDLNQSRCELKERLSYTARWLLNSVQKNVRQCVFLNTGNGYICFVLVRMGQAELDNLKKLTVGAKLTARVVGRNGDRAAIEVSESNGVGVTITEYQINANIRNVHARLITLFLWKVPESGNATFEGALAKHTFVRNGAVRVVIPLVNTATNIKSILMGSEIAQSITLTGYDELGRPVSFPVRLQ